MNDKRLYSDTPVKDAIGKWANELEAHLDKTLEKPTCPNIHNLRRSCRKGQSLLDLFTHDLSLSCGRVSRTLTRTLRASREIRNADVLQKFLSQQKFDLEDRFPRKKKVRTFRKRLRKYWKKVIDSQERCYEEIVSHLHENHRSLRTHPREEMDQTLEGLRDSYRLWSSGIEKDFTHVHDLRITLKMISGRIAVLGSVPEYGPPITESRKKDLERILQLLGRMSDLLMMEPLERRLKGKKNDRKLFMKKIKKIRHLTDTKITRLLMKNSRPSRHPSETVQGVAHTTP